MATQDIDYITVDHQTLLDFHGQYTFLNDNYLTEPDPPKHRLPPNLQLYETMSLIGLQNHPITGRELTVAEKNQVVFNNNCYNETHNLVLAPETLAGFYSWYDQSRMNRMPVSYLRDSPDTAEAYKIVKYYMTITDFQEHFKEFNPVDAKAEAYERVLAEGALNEKRQRGAWLLRHSSLNRPATPEERQWLKLSGTRYYALTYMDINHKIVHVLLTFHVGLGWVYYKDQIPEPSFTEFIEKVLDHEGIPYHGRISHYAK